MNLSGKVVLVTGASSGIGAATALVFAKEGARVAIVGRNETKLANVAQQCKLLGAQVLVIRADVSNEQEARTIVQKTVDHFGKLDVLVNNAGILRYAAIDDPNILEVFDEVMNTNLRAAVQLTNLATPHLVATKGNIVNISSISAHCVNGLKFMSYCVSKAALDHFTRCAALELSASGVRVNSVNPGPVRTDVFVNSGHNSADGDGKEWDQIKSLTALDRVSDPEEIGDIIAFLASDKAKGITGSIYLTDNGYLVKQKLIDIK